MQLSCILEFDGASKGNPGQAGAGAVLRADDGSLVQSLRVSSCFFFFLLTLIYLILLCFLHRFVDCVKVWE